MDSGKYTAVFAVCLMKPCFSGRGHLGFRSEGKLQVLRENPSSAIQKHAWNGLHVFAGEYCIHESYYVCFHMQRAATERSEKLRPKMQSETKVYLRSKRSHPQKWRSTFYLSFVTLVAYVWHITFLTWLRLCNISPVYCHWKRWAFLKLCRSWLLHSNSY